MILVDRQGFIRGHDGPLGDRLCSILSQFDKATLPDRLLINYAELTNSDAQALCDWLPGTRIRFLALEYNNLQEDVGPIFARLLVRFDCHLRFLSLSGNPIKSGWIPILESLSKNHKLRTLCMANSGINQEISKQMVEPFEQALSLIAVDFAGNNLDWNSAGRMVSALERRQAILLPQATLEKAESEKMRFEELVAKKNMAAAASAALERRLSFLRKSQRVDHLEEIWRKDSAKRELEELDMIAGLMAEAEKRKEAKKGKKKKAK